VLLNLLLNAAQSIPEGDASNNEIRVHTRSAGDDVVIEVRDTGAGIEPEVVGRVFEPFFTTKPIGVGTGLGLWICHGIVTSFGGRIEVESRPGKGSCFRVSLPVAHHEAPAVPSSARPRIPIRGRVLAIDDDTLFLSTMARVLGRQFEVVTVSSAREARDLIAGTEFDVILCDLMMPEMTGMDLHHELARTMPSEADKMIFLTGGTFTPRAQTFLDTVPNQRLEKPFDPKHIRALILDRVERRPAPQE
jgi:CheY-like chemotaxis protein